MKLLTEALLSTNIWTSVLLVIDDIVTKKVKGNSLPVFSQFFPPPIKIPVSSFCCSLTKQSC